MDGLSGGVVYGREDRRDGDGGVYGLDASDGTERWRYGESHGMSSYTPPVVGDEGVYFGWADDAVGSGNGELYAVGFDGTERWTREVGSVYDPPVVGDGVVYVGVDTGVIHRFGEDGDEHWRFEPSPDSRTYSPSVDGVNDGVAYVTAAGNLYARDAENGGGVWEYDTEERVSEVHVDDGTAYGSVVGRVVAVAGGNEVWSHGVEATNPWMRGVAHGNVYFGHGREPRAVDAETGDAVWSEAVGEDYPVALDDEAVYAGERGLRAFSPGGDERWTTELDGSEIDGLTVGDGYVYAVTEEAVHRVEEGEAVGSVDVPNSNVLSHVATDGRVYVGNREGVYALDA